MKTKKFVMILLFTLTLCVMMIMVSCNLSSVPNIDNYYNITVTPDAMKYRYASKKIINSVVCIRATFGNITAKGSGTIVTEDGYILTNRHVACYNNNNPRKPTSLEVDILDHNYNIVTYNAELISETAKYSLDLAVIKITNSTKKFVPISIAKAISVKFADEALIIGNSASTGFTAQSALIANPKTTVSGINFSLIKINADINHGNSGGGLFNLKGDMIGIVTYRMEGTSSRPEDLITGIGYAINTDDIKATLLQSFPQIYEKIKYETYDDTVTEDGNNSAEKKYGNLI